MLIKKIKYKFFTLISKMIGYDFFQCRGDYCGSKYAVEKETIEEPACPVCGSYYFSVIPDCE